MWAYIVRNIAPFGTEDCLPGVWKNIFLSCGALEPQADVQNSLVEVGGV